MSNKPFVIGISGGSGSGKTTFVNELSKKFTPEQVCILSQDNYYRPREEQIVDDKGEWNFDLPESFKKEEFHQDVLKLINGKTVEIKEYTYNNPLVEPKILKFEPAPVLVVEGIFVFHFDDVSDLMDLKIFIEADEHIKLIRRIRRDKVERNYPLEDVLYKYEHHVYPTFQKYILPYKSSCNIIVNNNVSFVDAMEALKLFILEKLETTNN